MIELLRFLEGRTPLSARRMQHFLGNLRQIRNIYRADRVVGPYAARYEFAERFSGLQLSAANAS